MKQKKTVKPGRVMERLVQRKQSATMVVRFLKGKGIMSKRAISPAATVICAMEPKYQWPVVSCSWHAPL